jgi:hypothetical protein
MLTGILLSSIFIYRIESQKRILQLELIELSKVKYGIFSVDEWEAELSEIIIKQLNEFELQEQKEDELRETVSTFLEDAVDALEESFYDRNSGSVKGFLKGSVASITDVFGVMRKDIPLITDSIIAFINDPKNKELAKEFLLEKMDEYSEKTFSEIDYTIYNEILEVHGAPDKETARLIIQTKLLLLEDQQSPYSILLFSLVFILFLGSTLVTSFEPIDFLLLTLICGCLLAVGLLLPMINIDARISKMEFQLMGESIVFTDQVLYFKSKSILEVVSVMIKSSKPDVIGVGLLVLSFSVLFPVSKLISSIFYIYSKKLRENKIIRFLVFKTSKWSMADVMVVAIFMAFIGFSGIISEQLKDLETITSYVDMMTTNASSLQIGFYLFTSFALLSILISHKLSYTDLKN